MFTHAQLLKCLLICQDLCQHSSHSSSHLGELLQKGDLGLQLLQDFLKISLSWTVWFGKIRDRSHQQQYTAGIVLEASCCITVITAADFVIHSICNEWCTSYLQGQNESKWNRLYRRFLEGHLLTCIALKGKLLPWFYLALCSHLSDTVWCTGWSEEEPPQTLGEDLEVLKGHSPLFSADAVCKTCWKEKKNKTLILQKTSSTPVGLSPLSLIHLCMNP